MKLSKGSMKTRPRLRLSQHPRVVVSAHTAKCLCLMSTMRCSGTNAVIVPLHLHMCGEIAECKVPSATVERPIVQVTASP